MRDPGIIIAGRGPSIVTADLPDLPICAVSSGVFACPRKPEHFVTLDAPKYFDGVRLPEGWATDPIAKWWDMVNDPEVVKHVPTSQNRTGYERTGVKPGVYETVDAEDIMIVLGAAKERPDLLGWQPGWADYPNVHDYKWDCNQPVNFGDSGPFGCGGEHCNKSLLMAVQVAARLGYRTMYFAGVDLHESGHVRMHDLLRKWYPLAYQQGIEWFNLSEESRLAEWMPRAGRCDVTAMGDTERKSMWCAPAPIEEVA